MMIDGFPHKDGGLGANNPAVLATKEIQQMHEDVHPFIIVSIGTGTPMEQTAKPQRVARFLRYIRSLGTTIGTLADIATDSEQAHGVLQDKVTAAKIHNMDQDEIKKRRPSRGSSEDARYAQMDKTWPYYFRFNVDGIADVELDAWDPKKGGTSTKEFLAGQTKAYLDLDTTKQQIFSCAAKLVDLRRRRLTTERWDRYAHGHVFRCAHHGCQKYYVRRSQLCGHAEKDHQYFRRGWLPELCRVEECQPKLQGREDEQTVRTHLWDQHEVRAAKLWEDEEMEAWLDGCRKAPYDLF